MDNFDSSVSVAVIVANLREARLSALEYAETFPQHTEGWRARAQECLEQLREIPGTVEWRDSGLEAARRGLDV